MSTLEECSRTEQSGIEWLDSGPRALLTEGTTKPGASRAVEVDAASRVRRRRPLAAPIAGIAGIASAALLVFSLVIPMIHQSRKDRCRDQLGRIGAALLEYESTHKQYPAAAITDANRRPLLSWRVAILPQLGLGSLYKQFRLDEPWDGPHNIALLSSMPEVYRCPSMPDGPAFATGYQVIVGPKPELGTIGTLFEWSRGIDVREVIDGTSNTVAVFETRRTIPWTRPGDPRFERDGPLPEFASGHEGGFHAVFGDGATRFLRNTIVPQTLRAMLTRDGNEVLSGG